MHKNSLRRLLWPLLAVTLIGCQQGGEEGKSSTSSLDDSSVSSSDVSSSISSSDQSLPMAWTESDLAAMKQYLGEGVNIPFPYGVSENYIEASGTDGDGVCFIVYDSTVGDITASYCAILEQNDFIADVTEEDEEGYYYYYKNVLDDTYQLWVQTDYYDGDFEIFAWVEALAPQYESFPYEVINEYFGMSLSEASFPSFSLATDEKYDAYGSDDGNYFYVGGYFDANTSDDDYLSAYQTALSNKGFVVDVSASSAINEGLGLKVEMMTFEGYFFIQISKYVAPKPGDNSLSFVAGDFANEYPSDEVSISKDGFSFYYSSVMKSSGYIQFRSASRGSGYLYNADSLGKITSIVVTMNGTDTAYYGVLSLYVSDSKITESDASKKVEPTASDGVYTYNIDTEVGYFLLIDESGYASKNDNVIINYSIG